MTTFSFDDLCMALANADRDHGRAAAALGLSVNEFKAQLANVSQREDWFSFRFLAKLLGLRNSDKAARKVISQLVKEDVLDMRSTGKPRNRPQPEYRWANGTPTSGDLEKVRKVAQEMFVAQVRVGYRKRKERANV